VGHPAGGPQTPRSTRRKQDHQRRRVHAVEVCELGLLATSRAREISTAVHQTSWSPHKRSSSTSAHNSGHASVWRVRSRLAALRTTWVSLRLGIRQADRVSDLDPEQIVAAFDSTSVRHGARSRPQWPAGSRTSGAPYWRTSPYRRRVDCQGRCCAEFARGSGLRRESVRIGWSMSILRRRRLVCGALSEATLSGDTARLRSTLKLTACTSVSGSTTTAHG
jgi:hypothetical protein